MEARRATVSIITPAYNAARFIEETFDSVRAQTFQDWEMLVVDDRSRDGTQDIIRKRAASDARIRWAQSPSNQGAGPSRNQALAMARGRFVAFLDADDLWDPTKLERQLAYMQQEACALSYTSYRVIDEQGVLLGAVGSVPQRTGYFDLLRRNCIGCLTVMLDRERVGEVLFPPLRTNQDFALWLRLLRAGHAAAGLNEELASYRIVATSNTRNKLKSARNVWRVYRAQGLPFPQTLWLYAHYAVNGTMKHLATRAHRAQALSGSKPVPGR